jgi:hypothetical protein
VLFDQVVNTVCSAGAPSGILESKNTSRHHFVALERHTSRCAISKLGVKHLDLISAFGFAFG